MSHCVQKSRSPPALVMTAVQPLIDFLITLYYLAEDKDKQRQRPTDLERPRCKMLLGVLGKIDSVPSICAPFSASGRIM